MHHTDMRMQCPIMHQSSCILATHALLSAKQSLGTARLRSACKDACHALHLALQQMHSCKTYATISWTVTGYLADANAHPADILTTFIMHDLHSACYSKPASTVQ